MSHGWGGGGVEEFEKEGIGEPGFEGKGGSGERRREEFADVVEVEWWGEVEVADEDGVGGAFAAVGAFGAGGECAEAGGEGGDARELRGGPSGVRTFFQGGGGGAGTFQIDYSQGPPYNTYGGGGAGGNGFAVIRFYF